MAFFRQEKGLMVELNVEAALAVNFLHLLSPCDSA